MGLKPMIRHPALQRELVEELRRVPLRCRRGSSIIDATMSKKALAT
jgi:hypothetical protein